MPPAFEYGVESKKEKKKLAVTLDEVTRSDRELARLFVGMFEGTGLVPLVLFPTEKEAQIADKKWGKAHGDWKIASLNLGDAKKPKPAKAGGSKGGKGGKAKGGGGFGAPAPAAAGSKTTVLTRVPGNAEVIFAVSPGPLQLPAVRSFCDSFGMDRLVVLLNPRLAEDGVDGEMASYFEAGEFQTVVEYAIDPHKAAAPGPDEDADAEGDPVVLWRAFPEEWLLARKPKVGAPRELLSGGERPTAAEMLAAVEGEASPGGAAGFISDLMGIN